MLITVTATKGGAGATAVAAAIGLTAPGTTLVDLTGDLAAAIGTEGHHGVGAADWLTSDAPVERLDELATAIEHTESLLLPHGGGHEVAVAAPAGRWALLGEWCVRRAASAAVVIDPGPNIAAVRGAVDAGRAVEVVVTRACFLALRQRVPAAMGPDGVVLIAEPGRALRSQDVERTLGAPVLATMPWAPAVARAIDAGLVSSGVPAAMRRTGRTVWRSLGGGDTRRRAA